MGNILFSQQIQYPNTALMKLFLHINNSYTIKPYKKISKALVTEEIETNYTQMKHHCKSQTCCIPNPNYRIINPTTK